MLRPLPNIHRLLGLVLAAWLLWLALGEQIAGRQEQVQHMYSKAHPTPTKRSTGSREKKEHNSPMHPWLLQVFWEFKHDQAAQGRGKGSIANCLLFTLILPHYHRLLRGRGGPNFSAVLGWLGRTVMGKACSNTSSIASMFRQHRDSREKEAARPCDPPLSCPHLV